jgi:hypothetical protein
MNKLVLVSSLAILLTACGSDSAKDAVEKKTEKAVVVTKEVINDKAEKVTDAFDKKAAVLEAKTITKAFGGALKTELKKAMKAGGAVNALDVCNTEANPIAEKSAKEHNALISRVSLKNRNPDNVPNDWQRAVLEDFNVRAAKGENVKKMGFAEVVEHDGKKQLRFMKALPTGGLCLECHGTNIEADVEDKITALYPDDKATGYEKGQVRGAVVILKDY